MMFDLGSFIGGVVFGIMLIVLPAILVGEPANQKILDECIKKYWVAECQVVALPRPKPAQ